MEIIISEEALVAARATQELGQRFEDRAVALGMEDASLEDLISLLQEVEDEMEKQ